MLSPEGQNMQQPEGSRDYRAATQSARERLAEVGAWVEEFSSDFSGENAASVIYVFDTDVITMYSRPSLQSNYAALLRSEQTARTAMRARLDGLPSSDLDECELVLADLLGNYIVWGRQQPALNSPVHADELASVCIQVWLAAKKQMPALHDRLRKDFVNLKDTFPSEKDENSKRDWIEGKVNGTLKKLTGETPEVVEALRLQQAFDGNRIYSIEGHRLSLGGLIEQEFLPSAYDESGDLRPEIYALGKQLLQILVSGYSMSEYRVKKMRDDATAIAHLSWLNQQLDAMGRSERVRLVTGSPHLHRLKDTEHFPKSRLSPELWKTLNKLAPELKCLLRHPLGFLEDRGIRTLLTLEQGQFGEGDVGGRLGAFLADRINRGQAHEALDGEVASSEHDDYHPQKDGGETQELFIGAVNDCTNLLRAALARQFVQPEKSWVSQIISDILASNASEWDDIIKGHISSLLPKFLASLATIQANPRGHKVSRNLPPLCLVSPQVSSSLCDSLYQDHSNASGLTITSRELLEKVIAEDRSFYTPLLMIALSRAMERDWNGAKKMAHAACKIADSIVTARKASADGIPEAIYGEEAYYLSAITRRLTAGKIGNPYAIKSLDVALADIEIAMKRAEEFCAEYDCSFAKNLDARHSSEKISIELTKRFYKRLGEKAEFNAACERELFDRGFALLETLLKGSAPISEQDYLTQYIHQQICLSLAQLVMLDRYAVSGMEVFPIVSKTWSEADGYPMKLEELWQAFNSQCEFLGTDVHKGGASTKPTLVVSSLVRLVWKTLALELRKVSCAECEAVKSDITKSASQNHYVAGIDPVRFNFLHKIAMRRLSAL